MSEKIKTNLGILGFIIAVLALIVAVLNWLTLNPFEPTSVSSVNTELIEVAAGQKTTTSGFWQYSADYSFPSHAIVDRQTDELHCDIGIESGNSYWLLPDKSNGWIEIDLASDYAITKFRYLNTHNGSCGDRATKKFHIAVSNSGEFSGEEIIVAEGEMPFTFSPDFQETTLSNPVPGRYVRFYVDEYYEWGGGLNELEVYALGTVQ
jgi:hypothetical protein